MTTPPPNPGIRQVPLREVWALLLTFAGLAGLVTVAFTVSPLLGWTLVSLLAVAVGVYLSLSEA